MTIISCARSSGTTSSRISIKSTRRIMCCFTSARYLPSFPSAVSSSSCASATSSGLYLRPLIAAGRRSGGRRVLCGRGGDEGPHSPLRATSSRGEGFGLWDFVALKESPCSCCAAGRFLVLEWFCSGNAWLDFIQFVLYVVSAKSPGV